VEIVGYLILTRGIASPLIKYDRKRLTSTCTLWLCIVLHVSIQEEEEVVKVKMVVGMISVHYIKALHPNYLSCSFFRKCADNSQLRESIMGPTNQVSGIDVTIDRH
jgi:hypothetical protein